MVQRTSSKDYQKRALGICLKGWLLDQISQPPLQMNWLRLGEKLFIYVIKSLLLLEKWVVFYMVLNRSEWLSFKENGFTSMRKGTQEIISIWKQSYDCLESPLKNCFRYCALFPKDFEIEKRC